MKRRAMKPADASRKKIAGHVHERHYAEIIGGTVIGGAPTSKTDVVDLQKQGHSLKSAEWWQIFLYGRDRFITDETFKSMGNIAKFLIECIDSFPELRQEYDADKMSAKIRLQVPMRKLLAELRDKPANRKAYYEKAFFNGDEVTYLSILPNKYKGAVKDDKVFHIFHRTDVVHELTKLTLENSKARHAAQMDDQKVIFKLEKNVGELEIRTDGPRHYRQAKFRVNGPQILKYLRFQLGTPQKLSSQIYVYGLAIDTFQLQQDP